MPSLRCCFFQRICYNGRISAAIIFLIAVFLARQRRATEKDGAGYRAALRCGIHAARTRPLSFLSPFSRPPKAGNRKKEVLP